MAETAPALPARPSWGVAALIAATSEALAARFGAVAVRGELSGFNRAASGHCYFALKDADGATALLRCAMFRRAALLVDFAPADGQQVELRGRLGVYEARGELQMVVESLQRVGAGTLYEEFLRRRARLAADGLFDDARKRALPAFPRAVGIVTSLGAAALRDVAATLQRRSPQVGVVVYPALVQGAAAPQALVDALTLANARAEVDVLLLVRGGGSLEDLWAFNDERLVRAVAASALPLVCGVGHESDVTLCDLAADLRAATPTAAAELVAPAQDSALQRLAEREHGLTRTLVHAFEQQTQRLDRLAQRLGQPGRGLGDRAQQLVELARRAQQALRHAQQRDATALQQWAARLVRGGRAQLERARAAGDTRAARLQSHNPQQVLQRGYVRVHDRAGRPVTRVAAVARGDELLTLWSDGAARVRVEDVERAAAIDPAAGAVPAARA